MNTIFIGGSRHVSRLSPHARERLQNVLACGAHVIVGDANGADTAVQKFLLDNNYHDVTVFCSGQDCRNNLGKWKTRNIKPPTGVKGFEFYAAKDREMARSADFGLMIWDGKSPGTILNILRLLKVEKKTVLLNTHDNSTLNFRTHDDWNDFLSHLNSDFRDDLRKRATADEWNFAESTREPSFFDPVPARKHSNAENQNVSVDDAAAAINAALASGNPAAVIDALGIVAKSIGMSQVAKETGLARESLYRSLSTGGNPEFSTVWKVIAAMGLRLMVSKTTDGIR